MKRRTRLSSMVYAGLLLACGPMPDADELVSFDSDTQISALTEEARVAFVGRAAQLGFCPRIKGWEGPYALPNIKAAAYCLYEGTTASKTSALHVEGLKDVTPDMPVVAPLSGAVWTPLEQELARAFAAQTEARKHSLTDAATRAAVRVAIVDTAPTRSKPATFIDTEGVSGFDPSGHATAVSAIVRETACGKLSKDPTCIVALTSALAMPRSAPDGRADWVRGGYFGRQSEVVQAVHQAVSDFVSAKKREARLVVNLSLGWDPVYSEKSTVTAAVRDELHRAVCHGALVVAAAGNDSGSSTHTGPMYPAAFEREKTPSAQDCATFLRERYDETSASLPSKDAGYRPLVHSVGGVLGDDTPLPNGRPGGRPRLVAPAGFALGATPPEYIAPTRILTGTSVAAAVASAAAAIVWSVSPNLDASEAMQTVYAAGEAMEGTSDYGAGSRLRVRRIDICRTYVRACTAARPGACATERPCKRSADERPLLTDDGVRRPGLPTISADALVSVLPSPTVCASPAIHVALGTATPTYSCPERQLPNIIHEPSVDPQPTSNPCRVCRLNFEGGASAMLDIQIDASAGATSYTAPVLNIPGKGHFVLPVGMALHAGDQVLVPGLPVGADANLTAASISFVAATPGARFPLSATSPVVSFRRTEE